MIDKAPKIFGKLFFFLQTKSVSNVSLGPKNFNYFLTIIIVIIILSLSLSLSLSL